jgi:hypothetical protein
MEYGNWLGILKWSLTQSDGTAPTTATPMSEDDKKWLEQVMRETIKDEPKRMNEIMCEFVKMLDEGLTADKSDTVVDLLEELRSIVEQVDMAQVFAKFGGFECLMKLVECSNISAEARALSASTLAALTQNNLTVQEVALNDGLLDRLAIVYVQSESTSVCNRVCNPVSRGESSFLIVFLLQVLFALSCSIRNHQSAEEYFMHHLAAKILPKAISGLSSPSTLAETPGAEALANRALFLSSALATSDYSSAGRVEQLRALLLPLAEKGLESESIELRETTECLLTSLRNSPHTAAGNSSNAVLALK